MKQVIRISKNIIDRVPSVHLPLRDRNVPPAQQHLAKQTGKIALVGGDIVHSHTLHETIIARQAAFVLDRAVAFDQDTVVGIQAFIPPAVENPAISLAARSAKLLAGAIHARGVQEVVLFDKTAPLDSTNDGGMSPYDSLDQSVSQFSEGASGQDKRLFVAVANPRVGAQSFSSVYERMLVGGGVAMLEQAQGSAENNVWVPKA